MKQTKIFQENLVQNQNFSGSSNSQAYNQTRLSQDQGSYSIATVKPTRVNRLQNRQSRQFNNQSGTGQLKRQKSGGNRINSAVSGNGQRFNGQFQEQFGQTEQVYQSSMNSRQLMQQISMQKALTIDPTVQRNRLLTATQRISPKPKSFQKLGLNNSRRQKQQINVRNSMPNSFKRQEIADITLVGSPQVQIIPGEEYPQLRKSLQDNSDLTFNDIQMTLTNSRKNKGSTLNEFGAPYSPVFTPNAQQRIKNCSSRLHPPRSYTHGKNLQFNNHLLLVQFQNLAKEQSQPLWDFNTNTAKTFDKKVMDQSSELSSLARPNLHFGQVLLKQSNNQQDFRESQVPSDLNESLNNKGVTRASYRGSVKSLKLNSPYNELVHQMLGNQPQAMRKNELMLTGESVSQSGKPTDLIIRMSHRSMTNSVSRSPRKSKPSLSNSNLANGNSTARKTSLLQSVEGSGNAQVQPLIEDQSVEQAVSNDQLTKLLADYRRKVHAAETNQTINTETE